MRDNLVPLLAVSIVLAIAAHGCARRHPLLGTMPIKDSRILFNPEWNTPVVAGGERPSWPVAYAWDGSQPEATFRETIIDWQGQFGHSRDFYYRRVDSVRKSRRSR